MATTINADNGVSSGSAGLKQTADNSGSLVLQTNGTAAVTISTGQVATFANPASGAVKKRTRQVFLSGSSATYTTPSGCTQIWVRLKGGGGGGNGSGTAGYGNGSAGTNSSFNSIVANGGGAGVGPWTPGSGGNAGSGTASVRISGACGTTGHDDAGGGGAYLGGVGGGTGGGIGGTTSGSAGANGKANSGGGDGGGGASTLSIYSPGNGGGEGEYVELLIDSPAASYTYTVGGGGSGGSAGASGGAGGTGGSGFIIVDEFYW